MNSLVDEKIKLSNGKTLKLANIMIQEVNLKESADFSAVVLQMENYIKSKGAMPLGPLIQKTVYNVNEEGQLDIKIYLMRQSNNFIHNVGSPYTMESLIKVKNCMYVRYMLFSRLSAEVSVTLNEVEIPA